MKLKKDENMQKYKKKANKNKKNSPPLQGLAIASMFLIWGGLTFYLPTYLEIHNPVVFNTIGFLLLGFSLIFSLMEISSIWKNEAYSYWGVSLVFILPAVLLHFLTVYYEIVGVWNFIIRVGVSVLFFAGTPFIPFGFSYLVWRPENENKKEEELSKEEKTKNTTNTIQLVISLIITLLTLVTAIVQLLSQINN